MDRRAPVRPAVGCLLSSRFPQLAADDAEELWCYSQIGGYLLLRNFLHKGGVFLRKVEIALLSGKRKVLDGSQLLPDIGVLHKDAKESFELRDIREQSFQVVLLQLK